MRRILTAIHLWPKMARWRQDARHKNPTQSINAILGSGTFEATLQMAKTVRGSDVVSDQKNFMPYMFDASILSPGKLIITLDIALVAFLTLKFSGK